MGFHAATFAGKSLIKNCQDCCGSVKLRQMEQVESQRQRWVEWFKVILESIFLGDLLKQSWLNKTNRNTLQTRNLFALQWFSQGFQVLCLIVWLKVFLVLKLLGNNIDWAGFASKLYWMSNAQKWVWWFWMKKARELVNLCPLRLRVFPILCNALQKET